MGSLGDHKENNRAVGSARRQTRVVEGGLPHVRLSICDLIVALAYAVSEGGRKEGLVGSRTGGHAGGSTLSA